jgi:hypothetical protein
MNDAVGEAEGAVRVSRHLVVVCDEDDRHAVRSA